MRSALSVLLLLLAAPPARAEPKVSDCPPAAAMSKRVGNCGMNALAAKQARICARSLEAEAKARGLALKAVMERLRKTIGQSQKADLADAGRRLGLAIASLGGAIENLQKGTASLADYAGAMVDIPGSRGDATSMDCFNTAFHDLQKTVSALDKETVAAMNAREAALAMAATLADREGALEGPTRPASPGTAAAAPAPAFPGGKAPRSTSNVTGVDQDLRNEKARK